MARVIIVLEDQPDGRVDMASNPAAKDIAQIIKSGNKTTPAMDYALLMQNFVKKLSLKTPTRSPNISASGLVLPDSGEF